MSDPAAVLRLEPEDLDGHTVDELTDYLEAGCEPADPSIDRSPACRLALAALQRLRDVAGSYLEEGDAGASGGRDWIGAVLAALPVDTRAGRRFPITVEDPRVDAVVTEAAIRGLIRSIGDEVPGLLVGAVRIGIGDPAPLSVDVALVHGAGLPAAVAAFRRSLHRALPDHLPFAVGTIDVDVVQLIASPANGRGR
ncbi:hypothetical protein [uncultured Amnibacterium sp.]|uniref:hypothetical protein n=1 Tax=uncultured Amnibacterium sp. TaxID=1631851 RepID=UPI0035CA2F0B